MVRSSPYPPSILHPPWQTSRQSSHHLFHVWGLTRHPAARCQSRPICPKRPRVTLQSPPRTRCQPRVFYRLPRRTTGRLPHRMRRLRRRTLPWRPIFLLPTRGLRRQIGRLRRRTLCWRPSFLPGWMGRLRLRPPQLRRRPLNRCSWQQGRRTRHWRLRCLPARKARRGCHRRPHLSSTRRKGQQCSQSTRRHVSQSTCQSSCSRLPPTRLPRRCSRRRR